MEGAPGRSVPPEPWSHNLHYHRVILDAIPLGCERALDVGCGKGGLTRSLRDRVPHVTGIDRDERSIELARAHPRAGDISYLLGDFLATPFEPASLDLVTSIASLHHMDAGAALRRMADLLRPGGVVAVIGLARAAHRPTWPASFPPWLAAGFIVRPTPGGGMARQAGPTSPPRPTLPAPPTPPTPPTPHTSRRSSGHRR